MEENKKHRNSSRNKGKVPVCRLASLNKFSGVLIGRDIAGIFKEGHVYSVVEIQGQIMIQDLGEHAEPDYISGGRGTVSQYITSGVCMLTKAEYKVELDNN